ncbi:DUF89-domain-containing protein [Ramaria rubella]|nr:DUF89-domain-containing protein [Ramaria rubella]
MQYTPPYPPYDPTDKNGYFYETVVRRWPIILTGIIDTVYKENMALPKTDEENDAKIDSKVSEGKTIIQTLSKLKYEMGRDRMLEQIPDDGGPNVSIYNTVLHQLAKLNKNTWFSAPWLYAECYLYRLVRTYFSMTTYWKEYDPFRVQKEETFRSSASAIYQLAHTFAELYSEKQTLELDPAKLEVLFNEMLQMCLWGNATDLSLLTNITHEDIQRLQSAGRAAQEERKKYILMDNSDAAWKHISAVNDGRVDIVLDNAGFEVFTDMLLGDFLITFTPHVSRVVFHPKTLPWFVSDVLPTDFRNMVPTLLDPSTFDGHSSSTAQRTELEKLATRWKQHILSGRFSLSVPLDACIAESSPLADFWTSPSPFALMKNEAPALVKELEDSALVIFKGDLNYRKLTADVKWPPSTPFSLALGPLAGTFPILSLRTLKADVAVGLSDECALTLDAKDPKWRVNGKYALISFVSRDGLPGRNAE